MSTIFTQFENENVLRSYPFADGCTSKDTEGRSIGTGVLVDAALYPVNSTGRLYLSRISADGVVSVSDSTGIVMTASIETGSSALEFYDMTDLHRHSGTIIASSYDSLLSIVRPDDERRFRESETLFSTSCVFPVVNSGVTSVNIGGTGVISGEISFKNAKNDEIRVSTGGSDLRFDVIPSVEAEGLSSIRYIYCVVDGKTPFRIEKIPSGRATSGSGNAIAVYLDNIDRGMVCSNAHREDSIEMTDTCKECEDPEHCHKDPDQPVDIPYHYQIESVDVPSDGDGSFFLTVPNMTGYDNPLSITLIDGVTSPKSEVEIDSDGDNVSALLDNITSKGVVLQVPGLAPVQ